MPRPPRLPRRAVRRPARAAGLVRDGDGIHRTVELPSFRDAAIVAIADVAEEMDHHPDIDRWRTLHLTLVTHSAGGVTDFDRAGPPIDALLPA